jgi:hypothetical protein
MQPKHTHLLPARLKYSERSDARSLDMRVRVPIVVTVFDAPVPFRSGRKADPARRQLLPADKVIRAIYNNTPTAALVYRPQEGSTVVTHGGR